MGGFETRFRVLADHAFNLKCFWNPRIQPQYVAYLIANYEGGGMSGTERDLPFALEYAELLSRVNAAEHFYGTYRSLLETAPDKLSII